MEEDDSFRFLKKNLIKILFLGPLNFFFFFFFVEKFGNLECLKELKILIDDFFFFFFLKVA